MSFVACHWDDVAYRANAEHAPYCSLRCKQAAAYAKANPPPQCCEGFTPYLASADPGWPGGVADNAPQAVDSTAYFLEDSIDPEWEEEFALRGFYARGYRLAGRGHSNPEERARFAASKDE